MPLVIPADPLTVRLHGASLVHDKTRPYGAEIRVLLDKVWNVIRTRKIGHKGINWVVYDAGGILFAGVELDGETPADTGLDARDVRFDRYAVWKHIGPVERIGEAYDGMKQAMAASGLTKGHPFIEKYGHWTGDASTFEIDLMCPIA